MREPILFPKDVERFWSKVDRSGGPDDCWLWTAGCFPLGYGMFSIKAYPFLAHRISFFLHHGRWPNPCALHRCDVRNCVNPAHLFEGTIADNVADMMAKGRQRWSPPIGERNAATKLTAQDVQIIRVLVGIGCTPLEVAARYAISRRSVYGIISRNRWGHVPDYSHDAEDNRR
jgi:hypothetical protein